MAHEIATASGFNDLYDRLVTFLTSNTDLLATNQQWQVLRQHKDNLEQVVSDIAYLAPDWNNYNSPLETMRYENRALQGQSDSKRFRSHANSFTPGNYVQMKLRVAKPVTYVALRAGSGADAGYMIRDFRLQYSDDGDSWTTCLTAVGQTAWSDLEERSYDVPAATGAHLWWRIIIDDTNRAQYVSWTLMRLHNDAEVVNHYGNESFLKATGISGADEIFTGIRSEYDSDSGWYNWFLNGYTGYNPNEFSFFGQPGAIAAPHNCPMVPLWDQAMPYWFAANGRHVRFGVKVSTNYEGGYLGFILPYGSPNQYPYPLAVGGSLVAHTTMGSSWRYSHTSHRHGTFTGPGANSAYQAPPSEQCALYLRQLDGLWYGYANRPHTTSDPDSVADSFYSGGTGFQRGVWPHVTAGAGIGRGQLPFRDCLDGGYVLIPCVLFQRHPVGQVFGELEGCFYISGFNNGSENTTMHNGNNHIIFQNTYRNTPGEYWAMRLD